MLSRENRTAGVLGLLRAYIKAHQVPGSVTASVLVSVGVCQWAACFQFVHFVIPRSRVFMVHGPQAWPPCGPCAVPGPQVWPPHQHAPARNVRRAFGPQCFPASVLHYSLPLLGAPRELAEGGKRVQYLCAGAPHLYPLLRCLCFHSRLLFGLPYCLVEGRRRPRHTFAPRAPAYISLVFVVTASRAVPQAHRLSLPCVVLYQPRPFHVRAYVTTLGASLLWFCSLCAISCFSLSSLFCQC
jgi:hypothetical protein